MRAIVESKSDSLIAYNVLEKKIINSGFCTLCGAFEAACPVSAIQVKGEKVHRYMIARKTWIYAPSAMEYVPSPKLFCLEA